MISRSTRFTLSSAFGMPAWFALLAAWSLVGHAGDDDIDCRIMVQRATQTAIWAMPAVGMVDFRKATERDLGGTINDVVYLIKPFESKHGFLTANDVTAYAWGTLSSAN